MSSDKTFAHYSIAEKIGAGGMGEVFRATDSKLNRDVALKMLPDTLIDNAERLARFQREAQVLAQLNHHGIAAIYGLESEGSRHALAMELVEGPDLSAKVADGPLPVAEALDIALQLAEAVEAAHEKGIVHRDLKPANIKITPEGRVKVLDFGLAKALADDPADSGIDPAMSPTLTANMTMGNVILGTAAYMSPEQARGTEVDKRADIWAYGVILVEMLGGKKLFAGPTVSDTLASVLQAQIDFDDLPEDLPADARRLIRRCLQRDPHQRLRDIGDARIILQDVITGSEDEETGDGPAPVRGTKAGVWAAVLLAGVVIAGAGAWFLKPGPEPVLRKLELGLAKEAQLDASRGGLAISPDGTRIAYIDQDRLWIRRLDQTKPVEIPDSEGAALPTWSPDGNWLAFYAEDFIWKIPGGGGQRIRVSQPPSQMGTAAGLAWGADGRIFLTPGNEGVFAMPASGGNAVEVAAVDRTQEQDYHDAAALPDGRGVLYVIHRLMDGISALGIWDGEKGKQIKNFPGEVLKNPTWSPTGHILYAVGDDDTSIWALAFDLDRLEASGDPFLVAQLADRPSVSDDGHLVYLSGGTVDQDHELVLMDRQGELVHNFGIAPNIWPFPALVPGAQEAVALARTGPNWDVWLFDRRGAQVRLSDNPYEEDCPVVTPDGNFVYFGVGHAEDWKISRLSLDGTGTEQILDLEDHPPHYYGSNPWISPDGSFMLYSSDEGENKNDIARIELNVEGAKPEVIYSTPNRELGAKLSPDGRYMAYLSDSSGRFEVYLAQYPSGAGRRQVSVDGGMWPRWKGDGSEIYYVAGDSLMVVDVDLSNRPLIGMPRGLIEIGPTTHSLAAGFLKDFDMTPDGELFLITREVQVEGKTAEDTRIVFVENWYEEFRK